MYAIVSGRLCLEGYVVDFNGRVGKTLIKPNLWDNLRNWLIKTYILNLDAHPVFSL